MRYKQEQQRQAAVRIQASVRRFVGQSLADSDFETPREYGCSKSSDLCARLLCTGTVLFAAVCRALATGSCPWSASTLKIYCHM